jgi:cellulose synthase/poly-beta-1,6-N-acetylglucosamine synthase-like glycosyltransferase
VLQSNTASHFYAIRHFKKPHERLTIIDSDNLVHPEYLNELNKLFDRGFEAVQGMRMPKNLNTTFACLDAARDIYYHYYDGKILFSIGSSATLSGSGMAFSTSLYKECLKHLDIKGAGFDKILQAEIVKKGKRIAFAPEAKVFDEKTSRNDQLVNQRARWINTWFRYFSFGFDLIGKGLKRLNLNQFLFGLILLRPPLFIFLILSFVFMVLNIWISPVAVLIWLGAFLCFIGAFALALILSETDKRIYRSLKNIPVFVFYQLVSLFKMKELNKISVATKHYTTSRLDELKK